MSEKTKNAFIVRDFKDAGTEQSFTAGDTVPIKEGAFINYKAAGLVTDPPAARTKTAKQKPKGDVVDPAPGAQSASVESGPAT